MKTISEEKTQQFFERVTRQWWFALLIPLCSLIPPIVQKNGFAYTDFAKWFGTIGFIGSNNFTSLFLPYSVLFNSIAMMMFALVFVLKNKFSRFFSIYVALMMLFFAVTQNTSVTQEYGLGIITFSYVIAPVLAGIWFWEATVNKNVFAFPPKITIWRISALAFAFFAFWNPINPSTIGPDFNPVYLLTNASSTMLCTFTPMVLAILFLYYPNINSAALRITGLTGVTIGFWQMLTDFVIFPARLWWVGVLHLPIFLLSLAGVVVSFTIKPIESGVIANDKSQARV